MRTALTVVTTSLALLTAVVRWLAHHSFVAEFDDKQVVNIEGTVTKMEWVNPHAWIHLDVKNKDGSVTPWMVEANTPTACCAADSRRSRWKWTVLLINGYRARSGENKANGNTATFKDGKRLFLGSSRGEEPNKEQ